MTFNVATAICDDHTKNFTFLLPEGGGWRLSPAYDVTHAHDPDSRVDSAAPHGRERALRRHRPGGRYGGGDRFAVPGASGIVEQVLETVTKWRTFADEVRVPEATTEHIAADIDRWSAPLWR